MKFEERVGRGAIIRPVQRFKYLYWEFRVLENPYKDEDEDEGKKKKGARR